MFDPKVPYNDLPMLSNDRATYYSPEIMEKLISARSALAELKGSTSRLPNPTMLVNTISMQESKDSSTIENILTTTDSLYQALIVESKAASPATKEVLNYREALWSGINDMKEKTQIELTSIIEIFRQIHQLERGEIRRPAATKEHLLRVKLLPENPLKEPVIIYTPPDGKGVLEALLKNLLEFINDDKKYAFDPLLKLAVSHYQFEAIHPFFDGNGRTGRILNILILLNKQLLELPILYLSRYMVMEKSQYYNLIRTVTEKQNWEPWILYILDAVEATSKYTIRKIRAIEELLNSTHQLVAKHHPKLNKEVVEAVFSQPYIRSVNLIDNDIYKVSSRPTAISHLNKLVELGVISGPERIGKEAVYVNQHLLRIISEED
jgi:Fic family protein